MRRLIAGFAAAVLAYGCAITVRSVDKERVGTGLYLYSLSPGGLDHMEIIPSTGEIVWVWPFKDGLRPIDLAFSRDKKLLYVIYNNSDTLVVYSIHQGNGIPTPIETIPIQDKPAAIFVHPTKDYMYIAYQGVPTSVEFYHLDPLSGLPTHQQTDTNPQTNPIHIALSPDGAMLVVTNSGSNTTSVYTVDTGGGANDGRLTFVENELSASSPSQFVFLSNTKALQIGPDYGDVYGASEDAVSLLTIAGGQINAWNPGVDRALTESDPFRMYFIPSDSKLLVPNISSHNVNVYDVNVVTGVLTEEGGSPYAYAGTGRGPTEFVFHPDDSSIIYAAEFSNDSVSAVQYPGFAAYNNYSVRVTQNPERIRVLDLRN